MVHLETDGRGGLKGWPRKEKFDPHFLAANIFFEHVGPQETKQFGGRVGGAGGFHTK